MTFYRMPQLSILLADDNDANRLISRTILERAGHTVTTAQNGSHALSLAKTISFELIILDIMMPVMDGMRALRKLRRNASPNKATPAFALTAYCSAEDRQRYYVAGFDSVLSKPLRLGDLETAYRQHETKNVVATVDITPVVFHPNVPLLDDEMISQLTESADLTRISIIEVSFWKSMGTECETMKQVLPEALRGDGQSLSRFRRAVHAIKGASASIGLSRLSDIARQLQNAPPCDIPLLMRAFVDTVTESRPALTKVLTGAGQLNAAVKMSRQDETKPAHYG